MTVSDIFQSDLTWFGAEARMVGGGVILIRGRRFGGTDVTRCGLPFALRVSLTYQPADDLALPTPAQYARISEFERRVLDPMESAGLGVVTLIETGLGSVRYLIYLKDGDDAFGRLRGSIRDEDDAYYASDDDPVWEHYADRMKGIKDPADEGAE